jgi:hypothetical protein
MISAIPSIDRFAYLRSRIAEKSDCYDAAAIRSVGESLNVPDADVYAAWERAAATGTNTDEFGNWTV